MTTLVLGPRDSAIIIRESGEVEGLISSHEDACGCATLSAQRIACLLALAHGSPDMALELYEKLERAENKP